MTDFFVKTKSHNISPTRMIIFILPQILTDGHGFLPCGWWVLNTNFTNFTNLFGLTDTQMDTDFYHADGGFWTRIARISRIFLGTRIDTDGHGFYHADELIQCSGWRYSCDSWNSCSKNIRVLWVIRSIPFKFRGWINPMFRTERSVFICVYPCANIFVRFVKFVFKKYPCAKIYPFNPV